MNPIAAPVASRNRIGTASLLVAVGGAGICRAALSGPLAGAGWLELAAAGFEAAMVGGLADWFAVTALFRHPLGIPIPHTAIIPRSRAKIVESIVSMVEGELLSPVVISARLATFAPSTSVVEWLRQPEHVQRLGAPLRDLLRALARTLTESEVAAFADRAVRRQLRELTIDRSIGEWLARATASDGVDSALSSVALSLANLADRPRTAAELQWWLDRSARTLREGGKRLVPLVLRRRIVQRKIVEAACSYASAELRSAAQDHEHPLRTLVLGTIRRFAARVASGDVDALAQVGQLRDALVESLEAAPVVRAMLARLRQQLEDDLAAPGSYLSDFVDRQLRSGILELFADAERRTAFDHWVRTTADDLLRRHHHQIGVTVREYLENLETPVLVAQIEDRVGSDLQFIRLNGALVGGLIGVAIALLHRLAG